MTRKQWFGAVLGWIAAVFGVKQAKAGENGAKLWIREVNYAAKTVTLGEKPIGLVGYTYKPANWAGMKVVVDPRQARDRVDFVSYGWRQGTVYNLRLPEGYE
jgi:hypothetical protein